MSAGQLKQVLATQASSKIPWGEKRYFSREQFEADLKRIVAFYTDRGFPDARVTSFDVKLSEDQTSVKITVNISEGQPIVVERIAFEGFESLPDRRRQRMERTLPLKPGQPLDRALIQASRETALDQLRDNGHPYASVRLAELPGENDHSRILEFRADPGAVAHYGDIEISGNKSVSENVVRRHLLFKPGDLYRVSRLRESQRQLYGLELFQFANIEPIGTEENKPPIVPTRVTVTEGKHRRIDLSGGYGSEERARAEVDWRHVNFFGGARTAGIRARYSGLDGGVRLNFTQPYVFSPRYSLTLSAQAWHSAEPTYTLNTEGGRITLTRQFTRGTGRMPGRSPRMTFAVTYANERESYEISEEALQDPTFRDDLIAIGLDPRRAKSEGRRSAVILDAMRNTTNNLLDARRGYVASLHLERAGTLLGGTYDYYELTGEGRLYRSLGDAIVLAGQVRGGSIDSAGDPDIFLPFFKRYFLGGASNLRGWGRFQVSPLSAGLPIGGTTFLTFSTEARFPVWGKLGGVIFLDGGNVWENAWDFNLGDMRYDIGPGLRYSTPIGPARVDVGYQLNPIPGLLIDGQKQERRFRIHFSIGQAF